jgi:hypothetical protein
LVKIWGLAKEQHLIRYFNNTPNRYFTELMLTLLSSDEKIARNNSEQAGQMRFTLCLIASQLSSTY